MTTQTTPCPEYVLLICSVGGTPEPIVASLLHWRPAAIRFIVSEQTRPQVDLVLGSYAQDSGQSLSPGCYDYVPVGDPEDLGKVVQVLRSLSQVVREWDARGADYPVIVDFTGGTKCMSAALALAARAWPCNFSYVGGQRRSKQGVGVVESGSERFVHSANPWNDLAYQPVEDAANVFNHGGYAAAANLLDSAVRGATGAVKRELSTLKAATDAYAAWDRFDHTTARNRFDDALRNRNDLAVMFTDDQSLIARMERHRERVAQLAGEGDATTAWVEDLFSNALRRGAEHRYDDAVARLYRAFEALAQVRLRDCYGILDTKSVSLDSLPNELQDRWRARAKDGKVFLGLRDAYALLRALGDDLGDKFADAGLDNDEKSPLVARNQSILAHGFHPVGTKAYNALREKLCTLHEFPDDRQDWHLPRLR